MWQWIKSLFREEQNQNEIEVVTPKAETVVNADPEVVIKKLKTKNKPIKKKTKPKNKKVGKK